MNPTQDIVSGDEIISDGYPLKEIDDTFFEVDTKMVAPKGEDFGQQRILSSLP